jgi:hypothetical protein
MHLLLNILLLILIPGVPFGVLFWLLCRYVQREK